MLCNMAIVCAVAFKNTPTGSQQSIHKMHAFHMNIKRASSVTAK